MATKKRKVKRVVLGEGHPWYFTSTPRSGFYDSVQLTQKPVASSILFRGGETLVPLDWGGTGNWNRVRLVLEILG